jgi:hypothetical protein
MYRIAFGIIVVAILGTWLYFSKPDKVVINEKGKVEGLVNKARELIQGDKFWKLQLIMANDIYVKSTAPHPPSSSELQTLYNKMREAQKELDDRMKGLYTPEEQLANSLRIKADSIERSGKWRIMNEAEDSLRLLEAGKYKKILPLIEKKLRIKPTIPDSTNLYNPNS